MFIATVINDDLSIEFPQIGIQCTKKKDVEENLEKRRKLKVDPFGQKVSEIDLNAVKLCFQVMIQCI